MTRLFPAAVVLACACSTAAAQAPLPATPDIAAAYDITLANHAGTLDPHNRAFTANLKAARDHGLALAAQVADANGYVAAVQGFTARIGDGHAGLYFKLDAGALAPYEWPGFVAA